MKLSRVIAMHDRPAVPRLAWFGKSLGLAVLCAALLWRAASGQEPVKPVPPDHAEQMAKGRELFAKHVRPILVQHCIKCHGGDKIKGELDLATRDSLLRGGSGGPAVVAGKAKASRLYKLITHQEKPHMPAQAPKLSDVQITHIAAWIDTGAAYDKPLVERVAKVKKPMVVTDEDRKFWSFQPLKNHPLPAVKNLSWCRTPLDRFILAKLEAKGLTPNPLVDRRKLIRRAYFDLLGLPPTPEEVEKFVNDPAPDAYPRLIDRLLDSPHFGERWARHWLDIARFAESHGFEHDYDRPFAYHYRDFVIKAFNQDLPFNTFVKWQIAGDEYEPDNPLALAATGFLAAGTHSTQITKNLVEKERYEELDDMARTTGTAMLGLTVGCARCHDHKYDPIPTRDYYRLLSTFTTTVRSDYDVNMDPAGYKKAKAKFDAEHAKLVEVLEKFEWNALANRVGKWWDKRPRPYPAPDWLVLDLTNTKVKSKGGATFTKLDDDSILVSGKQVDFDTYTFSITTGLTKITAIRLEALAHESLVKGGPGRADNGNFALTDFRVTAAPASAFFRPILKPLPKSVAVKLVRPRATFEQKGFPIAAAIDGDKKSAWAIDPQFGKDHVAIFEFEKPVGFSCGTEFEITLDFKNNKKHSIGRLRLSVSTSDKPGGFNGSSMPLEIFDLLNWWDDPKSERAPGDEKWLDPVFKWWIRQEPEWRKLKQRIDDHKKLEPRPPLVKMLICSEGVKPLRLHTQGEDFFPKTYFLKRGDVDQKDGEATQSFLQVLMRKADEKRWQTPPPKGWRTSYRRRALAEWLTDEKEGAGHLLARVIVNRLWQHHLGRGIVGTPSDFGFQGERPTHPELLDWLANELIKNNWKLKPIHKLIMTSAVYMQSSEHDKNKAAVDMENRLFWKRPTRRLEAEVIRDAMLAVSGTLDERMFGPGTLDVKQKRRSIYFFIKRSKLIPTMILFDAPDALGGMDRRPTTTIAPQALLIINNSIVRSYADSFAKRISPKDHTPLPDVVRRGYLTALGRPPSAAELADTVEFVQEQMASYKTDGRPNPRQLALGDFCQVLMGLNEFIYID
jgi:mono/diheme cytochrome c family protein